MNLYLDITKSGNHALDVCKEEHGIQAVILEKNQEVQVIYIARGSERKEPACVIIPKRGMMFQIGGELFRLVEIRREFIGTDEEWTQKSIQEHQRHKDFNYYAVLVPSLKYTNGLHVFMQRPGVEICNRREEMCNG